MIKSLDGERLTPKQKAQELVLDAIVSVVMYRLNEEEGQMTEREKAQVEDQIVKQKERVEKLFGFQPGSWGFG